MPLTDNQLGILDHTLHRASVPGLFCGDSADMQVLVQLGYMASAGRVQLVPDEYFRITATGRDAWQAWKDAQPEPPRISRRKALAKQRYGTWLSSGAADCGISFGTWIKEH